MASSIIDLIKQQVTAQTGGIQIPSNAQQTVVNGLSESILGSLTQTLTKAGGVDQIKQLLTGKTAAASSPITDLAGKLFAGNILSKLNLGNVLNGKLSALIPVIMGKLSGILKDQDGDGDVDFQDILLTLKGGGNARQTQTGGLGGGLLGGILGKVLGGTR